MANPTEKSPSTSWLLFPGIAIKYLKIKPLIGRLRVCLIIAIIAAVISGAGLQAGPPLSRLNPPWIVLLSGLRLTSLLSLMPLVA